MNPVVENPNLPTKHNHMEYTEANNPMWPPPQSREGGLFTDLSLYAEALALAREYESITVSLLQHSLGQRMQKMRLVLRQSQRTLERLLREMRYFGWITPQEGSTNLPEAEHIITQGGQLALKLSSQDAHAFRRQLTVKMQEVYVIPGWFISRLWQINPREQGEVIIPAPSRNWRPASQSWQDTKWNESLNEQTLAAAHHARTISQNAFPVQDQDWLPAVREIWGRLSNFKPPTQEKERRARYSPRSRLAVAMREASVKLLFNRKPYGDVKADFPGERPPIYHRTFIGWCPRLEAVELIFYTDTHPHVDGRLIFPTSVFRLSASEERFEQVSEIKHPNGKTLWLHQPRWDVMRTAFLDTLIKVHHQQVTEKGSLYISLLDARDEVCRQLRLSSITFDQFLNKAIHELPSKDFPWSVAIETDIREEQSTGSGQLRRPVYIEEIPHTLIALARLP